MDKKDKQILDILEKELKTEVENTDVPLRLHKESIVRMLENADKNKAEIKDISSANSRNNNRIIIRKAIAIAAMLAIVVSGALLMKPQSGVKVVRADTFHEKLKDFSPVKGVESIEDIEKAVKEILDESRDDNTDTVQTTRPFNPDNNSGTAAANPSETDHIIESYSGYIASAKLENIEVGETELINAKNPDGIAVYGDFKADIVKTDGEYLYIATTGTNIETGDTVEQIKTVKISANGEMEAVSTVVLSEGTVGGSFDECIEIHLKGDRLTAIMKRHRYSFEESGKVYDNVSTIAVYYDISDPYAPVKIREHLQDGEYISSALYGNKLSLVTAKSIAGKYCDAGNVIPSFSIDGAQVNLDAGDIRIAVNDPGNSYLFVTVTDITDFTKGVGRFALLGCDNKIYCTSSAIVAVREFSSQAEDKNGERSTFTEVHKINLEGANVVYSGWYRLQGSLAGGVSVDEEKGYLKALTSDGKTNRLYVLDRDMKFIIGLDVFGGENVTGVSFIGDNCYVMAERNGSGKTMVIDFRNPSSPKVAGTVSEKAFPTELYEVSDTEFISIRDSRLELTEEENGEERVFMPMSITLFDVSDPANPSAAPSYSFDESIRSVAASDSRSVMIDKDKQILGIPVLKINNENGSRSSEYVLFDISGGELERIGTFAHSIVGDAAVRGICVGDILYTVSGEKVVAFDISADAPSDLKLAEFLL